MKTASATNYSFDPIADVAVGLDSAVEKQHCQFYRARCSVKAQVSEDVGCVCTQHHAKEILAYKRTVWAPHQATASTVSSMTAYTHLEIGNRAPSKCVDFVGCPHSQGAS